MRKPTALLLAAILTTGAATSTAHATAAADPAPTNVQVSWVEGKVNVVKVTWEEDAPRPNKIFARPIGTTQQRAWHYLPADAPNQYEYTGVDLWNLPPMQIGVVVGTVAAITSPAGLSAPFDSHMPNSELVSISQAATGMTVKWRPTPYQDTTPGDPLDRDIQRFEPMYEIGTRQVSLATPSTATQHTLTHPDRDYRFYVKSYSEWSEWAQGASVDVNHARLSITRAPVWIKWGLGMVVSGRYWPGPLVSQRVILQARNSSMSPWYVVGTTEGSPIDSTFEFNIPAQTRQYRIAMQNAVTTGQSINASVFYGAYTAPWSTQTYLHVHGSFPESYVRRGQTVTARVQMIPAVPSGLVALQRWNGKTWAFVQNIPLKNGYGSLSFVARTPGTATYRIYAPSTYYRGLPVAAAYSRNFTLTTS